MAPFGKAGGDEIHCELHALQWTPTLLPVGFECLRERAAVSLAK
jgi:hypothetical protein